MFFCAISGEAPQDPVVSSKSGHVYERRLIKKYISENGTDPITGDKLEEADLVDIKASPNSAPPRPPQFTSIPAILHALQNEWDALVLETHALRQQYNSTRQELSHALYQQDAATRVVARLIRERDAAREALSEVQTTMGIAPTNGANDVEMDTDGAELTLVLPEDIVKDINDTHESLSATRKKRKPPADYATASQVATYKAKETVGSLHSASTTGITSLALSTAAPGFFATGGNDKTVQLYDRDVGKVVATLKGHTKKINEVALRDGVDRPSLVVSASADKTSRIWSLDEDSGLYRPAHTIKGHTAELTGLALHPAGNVLALASADRTYSVHALATGQTLFTAPAGEDPYSTLSVHPDGRFLALGTSRGTVQIYDVRDASPLGTLDPPTGGSPFTVNSISFSENGYHVMAPASQSTVAIWDLRKLSTTHTIDLGSDFKIHRLSYDPSAQFLGIAGTSGVRVFAHKTWDTVISFDDRDITALAWGPSGKEIWGAGGREVTIWSEP